MKSMYLFAFAAMFALACGSQAKEGEACMDDGDCEEGLECHVHEHDEDEEEEEEEHDEEEGGICEAEGEHEDE